MGLEISQTMRCISAWMVLALCASIFSCAVQAQNVAIQSLQPTEGSLAGGTRLTIMGSGFSMEAMTMVYIGPFACNVIMHLSSDTILTCETTAASEGSYPVTVLSTLGDGSYSQASFCCFNFWSWTTPSLDTLTPAAGPPGSQVFLYGNPTYWISTLCNRADAANDVSACLSGILFQDYRCKYDLENIATTYVETGNPRYFGRHSYRLNCTLPNPLDGGTLDQASYPGLGVARNVNTTVHFEANLRGGMPLPSATAFMSDVNGWPYMYQIFAVVESISPATGSVAGGTTLTISGQGFPTWDLRQDKLDVIVGGQPCRVLTSEFTTITCLTAPLPAGFQAPSAIKGLYPGARGVQQLLFNINTNLYAPDYWKLNTTLAPASTSVVMDKWETPALTYGFCSRGRAFFTAPRDGPYVFMTAADDNAQLNGTWYLSNGTLVSTTLVNQPYWTGADNWNTYANQKSAPINMTAGQAILLESAHCNQINTPGMAQVGVIMPSQVPTWSSQTEQQLIQVQGTRSLRTFKFKYSWPIGSDVDNIVNVTVTASQAWILNDPRVGINITIDGAIQMTIPIASSPEAATAFLKTALSIGSSSTKLGVGKFVNDNQVTFQLAVNRTLRATLGVTAQLTMLNVVAPAPYARQNFSLASGCTWYNPALQYSTPAGSSYPPPPPLPVLDSTTLSSNASVTVTKVTLAGVLDPTGSWFLQVPQQGQMMPLLFSYSTSGSNVSAVFSSLTGVQPAPGGVAVSQNVRDGAYWSNIWTIITPMLSGNAYPAPVAVLGMDAPSGVIISTAITAVSADPIDGTINLSLGGFCDSASIDLSQDSNYDIGVKLSALPYMAGRSLRSVSKSGSQEYGWNIQLVWDPVATPGNVPELRITSANLTGTNLLASVISQQNGTSNIFMGPVTGEMLQLAVPQPNTVHVTVNGVPSACKANATCGFSYDANISPAITTVSPTTLNFHSVNSVDVTITGTLFNTSVVGNVVTIGGAPCGVTSATATQIVCRVNATDVASGQRELKVLVGNVGFATGSINVTVQALQLASVSNTAVNADAVTVLNITGQGFDGHLCGNNLVSVGSVPCGVVTCAPTWLLVLFHDASAITVGTTANITVELDDGSGATLDTITLPNQVTVANTGAMVASVSWPDGNVTSDILPGSGFDLTVTLDSNATAAAVKTIWIVPSIPTTYTVSGALAQSANLTNAYNNRIPCKASLAANLSGNQATCVAGPLPNGQYSIVVELNNGTTIAPADFSFAAGMYIDSVTPAVGSIGGNTTLTITGSGFNAANKSSNVVLLPVPISTTFLNGVLQCDVITATASQLTCRTRPHLAADASADDAVGMHVAPEASQPGQVTIVACAPNLSDILQLQCWSQGAAAAKAVSTNPANTIFSYDWTVTPTILGVVNVPPPPPADMNAAGNPAVLAKPGEQLQVFGAQLANVDTVQLRQGPAIRASVAVSSTNATDVFFNVPSNMPSGAYTIVLRNSDGSLSVNPDGNGLFTVVANMTSVSPSAGSLAGGNPITLTVDGAVWNSTNLNANQVSVGGAPCKVTAVSGSALTCTPSSILGTVRAEYWNLPAWSWNAFPDVLTYSNPVYATIVNGMDQNWGTGVAGPTVNPDFFVARFTFYLQVVTAGTYRFYLGADDQARLYVNDLLLGQKGDTMNIVLSPGNVKIQLTYVEYTGAASVRLQWDAGVGVQQAIPWFRVFPMQPGSPAPIQAAINGIPVLSGCPATTVTLPAMNAIVPTPETTTVAIPDGLCSVVLSSYLTPTLTQALPTTAITSPGELKLVGALLANTTTSAYHVTVAGVSCPITTAVLLNATDSTYSVNCTLPALPAGQWPVVLTVDGYGNARPALSTTSAAPSLTISYGVGISSVSVLPTATPVNRGAYWGDMTVTLSGWGFAATGNAQNKTNKVYYNSGFTYAASVPITILSANATSMTVRVGRWQFADFSMPSFNPYSSGIMTLTTAVYDSALPGPQVGTPSTVTANWQLKFDAQYSPHVTTASPSPLTTTPTAGSNLTLGWNIAIGSSSGLVAPVSGASMATRIELQNGLVGQRYNCSSLTGSSASLTTTSYSETLSCILPSYLPAGNYTVWVCVDPLGCGHFANPLMVNLTVTGVSPTSGSAAGGLAVTIFGSGFAADPTSVIVDFGGVPCKALTTSSTSMTCQLAPLSAIPASVSTRSVNIRPSAGSNTLSFPSIQFSFDPALTPVVSSLTPKRGSTAGGTNIILYGTGFPTNLAPGSVTVTIGNDTQCINAVILSSTQINCTTSAPATKGPVPLPITVSFAGIGNAWSMDVNSQPLTYHFVDLWSRPTTWGGNPPPVEGDSVFIPGGTTVMLDVSTPILGAVVCEGNLIFDDAPRDDELQLQATYILVKGGNLTIGTSDKPYPNKARITLYGGPNTIELPTYGAKNIAVRDGFVVLTGQAKTPTWTQLAATADVGQTQLIIEGPVNWVTGDEVVVASSSFFANETDRAFLVDVAYDSFTNTSTLYLDTPLQYTHLGITVPVPGDPYNRTISMRAEVAVLSRNIVIEGDEQSPQYLYGGQIMVNTPRTRPRANIQFEQVELRRMGQAFRLGRYSIHWHLHGDVAYNSWLKGLAIHDTYNRAATIHGTHRVITENCVSYNTMGHAWFLEDGIEYGNIYRNNLGILTRRSDALLDTDTTPAIFWVTNPNNTYINNRAAGSTNGYGFWYRFLSNPEGPSFTTSVCPKHNAMGEFTNNVAHSNMFYGLRVHPEYLPKLDPCGPDPDADGLFAQVPATFNGLLSYKNGMKGAIGTQLGLVRFANMTLVDNGGGPRQHVVNGKDNGANYEMTWVVDDRNREETSIYDRAGLYDSLLVSKTEQGNIGTAGRWPSGRKITGVIMQSPAEFHVKHTALASLVNVTFVNYTNDPQSQFKGALEFCGKCKNFQGGATTATKQLHFIQPGKPFLSEWSWGHQGIFLDTDGSLINSNNLPADLVAAANFPLGVGNLTWHSAVDSNLFDPAECVYVINSTTSNRGAFCSNALQYRRVMVHYHQPEAIKYRPLLVSSATGAVINTTRYNGTSVVYFTHYNEDGYQFTVPTTRDHQVHWQNAFRVDPESLTYHKPDPLADKGWVTLTTRHVQKKDHYDVNGRLGNLTAVPNPMLGAVQDGTLFYNKTFVPDMWWYGNYTYNSTAATVFIAGNVVHGSHYDVWSYACPASGCNSLPEQQVDMRAGLLLWSDNATWVNRPGGKPKPGENVTIPFGWNLLIDENPDVVALVIQGNVMFDWTKPITLNATYILVTGQGSLSAGNATNPFTGNALINLRGTRQTPDWAVSNDLNLGSKVLAAVRGGRIDLHGLPVVKRWTRLGAAAAANSNTLTLAEGFLGWSVGQRIIVTSTSWNPWQAEIRTIAAVALDTNGNDMLVLDAPLTYAHSAKIMDIPNAANGAFDMRAEVGLISSNIRITAEDGPVSKAPGGEMFGCRVIANGLSVLRMSHTTLDYCGQAALQRAAVMLDRLTTVDPSMFNISAPTNAIPNPSYVRDSAIIHSMDAALHVNSVTGNGILVTGNVLYESYDRHTVFVQGSGNTITRNLALGTIKDMTGKSSFDKDMPSTFLIESPINIITGNVAAGSERVGFMYRGLPCNVSPAMKANYANNTAHSNIVGAWLRESMESAPTGCTTINNFTTYLNWDFGIISTDGITTDVEMTGINIADTKFANMLILRKGGMTDPASVTTTNITLVGMSGPDVCSLCVNRVDGTNMDPGCHPKLARQSYNQQSPFTPSKGFLGSVFALLFTPGPEPYPWDGLKGYAMVYGVTRMSGTTLANFYGAGGCGGTFQTHALGNHQKEPEAFHPVFMRKTNIWNVAVDGMTKFYGPDPMWRNEADCDTINWSRDKQRLVDNDSLASDMNDTSVIELNCQGPLHVNFRVEDGTLTGSPSSVLGYNHNLRSFPYDQGTPLIPGPCQHSTTWDAYQCMPNSTNFELAAAQKPNPIPVGGIFGDPQHFVLESRDSDSESRDFGPVFFNVSGSVELSVAAQDHGWCFAYTCQKRLSTFWTYLPSGQLAEVSFTGTPSKVFRLHWPYADPSAEIILAINMQYTPNRRFAWSPSRGRLDPLSAPPTFGDSNPHGSFYWNQTSTVFTIKLRGSSEALEVRTEMALMVSQSLAVSFDQFYDVKEMFLSNLAFLLGIPVSRIQIAKVVPGSISLSYLIYDNPAASAGVISEPTFDMTNNVDPQTALYVNSLPPDQQAQWFTDASNTTSGGATTVNSPPPPPTTNPPPPPASPSDGPSLVQVVGSLLALPDSVGGIKVLSSTIDLQNSVIDPSTLQQINTVIADNATNSTSSGDGKKKTVIVGAVVGAVIGTTVLAAAAAAYIVVAKQSAWRPAGLKGRKVSPYPSMSGDHEAPTELAQGSTVAGLKVNPAISKAKEAGNVELTTPQTSLIGATPTPGTPGSPATSSFYIGSAPAGHGSAAAAPVAEASNFYTYPRASPAEWDHAARGRNNLPALRADPAGQWSANGHNAIVSQGGADGQAAMYGQPRLPGSPSLRNSPAWRP